MSQDREMSIWDHIGELSERLKIILIAVGIASLLVGTLPANPFNLSSYRIGNYTTIVSHIIKTLEENLLPEEAEIIAGGWIDAIKVYLTASLAIGFVLASPVVAYETWMYISPALYSHEKRALTSFVIGFVLLFLLGAVYTYYLIVPISFKVVLWIVVKSGAVPTFTLSDFINFIFLSLVATGLFFNFPLILLLLVKLGVISTETLTGNVRKVFLVILVVTAVLTPDPSPLSMLLLSVPFMGLYMLTILIGRRFERGKIE